MTISTVVSDEPRGFGRILRDGNGRVTGIVEEKAATAGTAGDHGIEFQSLLF